MKALVVDDDVVSRMALMDLLAGYAIFDLIEAEDGEAAWARLEAGLLPAICFCDVRMPRLSGIDLLQRMKEHSALADVPFVLVSSASDRETVLQAVKLGAVGYILKPLHAAEARAHLEKIFRITLDKLAENPLATIKRLNIEAARLGSYLNAFGEQIDSARHEIGALLAAGSSPQALQRLDAVHTGCTTLGLWQVAALVDLARVGALDGARIVAVLDNVADAVQRQRRRLDAASQVTLTLEIPGALA